MTRKQLAYVVIIMALVLIAISGIIKLAVQDHLSELDRLRSDVAKYQKIVAHSIPVEDVGKIVDKASHEYARYGAEFGFAWAKEGKTTEGLEQAMNAWVDEMIRWRKSIAKKKKTAPRLKLDGTGRVE